MQPCNCNNLKQNSTRFKKSIPMPAIVLWKRIQYHYRIRIINFQLSQRKKKLIVAFISLKFYTKFYRKSLHSSYIVESGLNFPISRWHTVSLCFASSFLSWEMNDDRKQLSSRISICFVETHRDHLPWSVICFTAWTTMVIYFTSIQASCGILEV